MRPFFFGRGVLAAACAGATIYLLAEGRFGPVAAPFDAAAAGVFIFLALYALLWDVRGQS